MKRPARTFALCLLLIAFDSALLFSQVGADKRPTPPKTNPPKSTPRKGTSPARTVRHTPTPSGEGASKRKEEANRREDEAKKETARKEEKRKEEEARNAEAKRKEIEATKRPGAVVKNSVGIELVYVPPGGFMMGSETEPDEKPVHRVSIGNGFYMGKYEVTQAQWQAVMGYNPSNFKGDNLPVEQASWNDAIAFIARLNAQKDGFTYRLPTEAEWEYACRAGTTGDYAGDLDSMAWYDANAGDARLSGDLNYDKLKANNNRTHPVGTKLPNAFGLFDMHGNVEEWCQDWYHATYAGAPDDGSAWLSEGEQERRVLRGGSWYDSAARLRSARHYVGVYPVFIGYGIAGFRIVAIR
ncbi:MAG: hypothetical protein QOJ64_1881 [Acidobacteriota bacterium]|jgi:formylglycine-generating enzyme required for sulfatase activity|nr:hypothetical protein [Acidobacteriota bacterium]